MVTLLLTRILPVTFLAFGAYLLGSGAADVFRAVASQSWPTVEGTVVRSEVRTDEDPRIGRPDTHRAAVEYAYTVGGRRYTSSRVAVVDRGTSRRAEAEDLVNRYPKGSLVTVHHHPRQPALAYLEVGFHWDLLPTLGLGLFPTLFGIAFLLGYRKHAAPGEVAQPTRLDGGPSSVVGRSTPGGECARAVMRETRTITKGLTPSRTAAKLSENASTSWRLGVLA